MSEHTPGPWDVNGIDTEKIRIGSRKIGDVAIVYNQSSRFDGTLSESRKCNAKLIAAAPELLKALQDILIFDSALSQENARAAIRKATEVSE